MKKQYEVKTIKVVYKCESCGRGDMEPVINGLLHKCTKCGIKQTLDRVYPYEYKKLVEIESE